MSASIELAGHKVVRIQESTVDWGPTVKACEEADVFLWTSTHGYALQWDQQDAAQAVNQLNMMLPTVGFHLDRFGGLVREDQLGKAIYWRLHHLFTPEADGELWERYGINHHWLPPGCYGPECVRGTPREEFAADVAFVGSWQSYHPEATHRRELIERLRGRYGARFRVWPGPHQPAIRNEALNDLYASVKVAVGDSCLLGDESDRNYWSDRVPECLGRGGFLIHPWVEGIQSCYLDGTHLRLWQMGDWTQLFDLIDHYVAHDSQREQIRDAGQQHVRETATYEIRVQQILDVLRSTGDLR